MAKILILKGCPFCGERAHWTKGNKETKITDRVSCLGCCAEVEGDYKPQSALELWNYRTADYYVSKNDRSVTVEGKNLD
ncbi:hypothetical protein vBKpMFBKp34_078 [Klebsiella phage vB_KpM_FBKp34]|nr:hypothetical protein vBKpMFBKp34_078 [Klebsiella phage vB_KpM_FBKp34]